MAGGNIGKKLGRFDTHANDLALARNAVDEYRDEMGSDGKRGWQQAAEVAEPPGMCRLEPVDGTVVNAPQLDQREVGGRLVPGAEGCSRIAREAPASQRQHRAGVKRVVRGGDGRSVWRGNARVFIERFRRRHRIADVVSPGEKNFAVGKRGERKVGLECTRCACQYPGVGGGIVDFGGSYDATGGGAVNHQYPATAENDGGVRQAAIVQSAVGAPVPRVGVVEYGGVQFVAWRAGLVFAADHQHLTARKQGCRLKCPRSGQALDCGPVAARRVEDLRIGEVGVARVSAMVSTHHQHLAVGQQGGRVFMAIGNLHGRGGRPETVGWIVNLGTMTSAISAYYQDSTVRQQRGCMETAPLIECSALRPTACVRVITVQRS